MTELICKHVRFHSEGDELSFFEWLKNIQAIKEITGVGDEIRLHLTNHDVDDASLRELISIFTRYNIDLSQLSQFQNKSNEEWFYQYKRAYWWNGVFGNTK